MPLNIYYFVSRELVFTTNNYNVKYRNFCTSKASTKTLWDLDIILAILKKKKNKRPTILLHK